MEDFAERLLQRKFDKVVHEYSFKDAILYSLGVGVGFDPNDESQEKFFYEDGLRPLPSMAVILSHPGFWAKEPDTDIDWVKVLHVGQEFEIHGSIPPSGEVYGTTRVTEVVDKGKGKGALISSERVVRDSASDDAICTVRTISLARGNGGFSGGESKRSARPQLVPDREPDFVCDLPTFPQSALIYRLSGDFNPLHASPQVARSAGFRGPILHGLCTFGVACHALLRSVCGYDETKLKKMGASFTAPLYPGETVRTYIWKGEQGYSFRCYAKEREVMVVNNGFASIS